MYIYTITHTHTFETSRKIVQKKIHLKYTGKQRNVLSKLTLAVGWRISLQTKYTELEID